MRNQCDGIELTFKFLNQTQNIHLLGRLPLQTPHVLGHKSRTYALELQRRE